MFKIHLKSHNGQYVCAEGGGDREVVANKAKADTWETFTIHDENGGRLQSGDIIYLAAHNGKYVCAEGGGGREVVANRAKVDVWETFVIEIENNGVSLPIRTKEYTRIGTAKHMETSATLSQNGIISAQTTTWTTWKAKGFTGGVIAVVGDENGNILFRSNVHSFGVDGEWIGRSRRTDM